MSHLLSHLPHVVLCELDELELLQPVCHPLGFSHLSPGGGRGRFFVLPSSLPRCVAARTVASPKVCFQAPREIQSHKADGRWLVCGLGTFSFIFLMAAIKAGISWGASEIGIRNWRSRYRAFSSKRGVSVWLRKAVFPTLQ